MFKRLVLFVEVLLMLSVVCCISELKIIFESGMKTGTMNKNVCFANGCVTRFLK